MSNNDNNKRIAKNTVFLYIRMFFILAVSLYTTRVVFRVLGVVDYGIYNVVSGFVMLFSFLNTSMANGIQRFYTVKAIKEGLEAETEVYNTSLFIQTVLAIILFIGLETGGIWYIHNHMIIPAERLESALWVFHASILSLILLILQIPYSAAIIAHERMDYYALVNIIEVFVRLVLVIALPYIPFDKLKCYGMLTMVVSTLCLLLYIGYSQKHLPHLRISFNLDKRLFASMLSFLGWNFFGTFSYLLQIQGLNLLLNAFFGPIVNAARGIAVMVMNAIQGFQINVVLAFRPQMMQAYSSNDIERATSLFFTLSKLVFIMLWIIALPIIIELRQVLTLWLGDDIPDDTSIFTCLIIVNTLISGLSSPITQIIHASGKMKTYQMTVSFILCSLIPISWIILKLGAPAVSVFIANVILTSVNQIACLVILRRIMVYDIVKYVRQVILPICFLTSSTTIIAWATSYTLNASLIRLLIVSCTSASSVLLFSYYVILDKNEKVFVHLIINKIKKR